MRRRAANPGLRGRLLGSVLSATALGLVVIIAGFNVILRGSLEGDANDLLRSRASSALAGLRVVDGRLEVVEAPDDATLDRPIWIFAGGQPLERPRAGRALDAAAGRLAGGPERRLEVPGAAARLLALPVVARGQRVGTVVAGLSLTPYQDTRRQVLSASIALGLVLLLAVALAARWLLAAGLRPVDRMTAAAAQWSERDLDRRFAVAPAAREDELTRLAATLDGLLDRVAAGMRREQRFSAELSHELRTPLARVRAQAQLALGEDAGRAEYRGALRAVLAGTDEITGALDALLLAARAETRTHPRVSDARAVARAVVAGCGSLAAERDLAVRLAPSPPGLRVAAEAELAERILHPILANACRYAATKIDISLRREHGTIEYLVEDDGPGVQAAERETIFEPGARGSAGAAAGATHGAGLGLALARRLARAAGGDVQAPPGGGGRFAVRLPGG